MAWLVQYCLILCHKVKYFFETSASSTKMHSPYIKEVTIMLSIVVLTKCMCILLTVKYQHILINSIIHNWHEPCV
jgi:hypothetical protein